MTNPAAPTGTDVANHVTGFTTRFWRDMLSESHARYWNRRATTFEAARPQPGDHTGNATLTELTDRDHRLATIAQACRNAATLALITAHDEAGDTP